MIFNFKIYPVKLCGIMPDAFGLQSDNNSTRFNRIIVSLFKPLTAKQSFVAEKLDMDFICFEKGSCHVVIKTQFY